MTRVLFGIAVCLLVPARVAAIDFADDFQSGTLSSWQCNPCEDWSVTCANAEGTALVIQPFLPALLSTLCIRNLVWADFQLDVDLRGLIPTDKMVRFRYSEQSGSYYYINMRSDPPNDLWLSRFDPGYPSTTLGTVPLTHQVGEWHHLTIKAEGEHIRVWVDSDLRIDATDPNPLASGTICLGGWTGAASKCGVQWDNVQILDLVVPAAPTTWGRVKAIYSK
jgi:hypothetical protein